MMKNIKSYIELLLCFIISISSFYFCYVAGFIWLVSPVIVENGIGRMMNKRELWTYGAVTIITFVLAISCIYDAIRIINKMRTKLKN